MAGYIPRDVYLQKLIDSRLSGDVKVVTGPRRCGKSWLLTRLYKDYLIADGVPEEDIIIVSLDMDDENNQSELADKEKLKAYLYGKITDPKRTYYVMLDEIQEVDGFEKLVNGLRNKDNVDVYVTGSNAKLLSKDISTIFRDRGQEIRCNPFSFKEFCTGRTEPFNELWKESITPMAECLVSFAVKLSCRKPITCRTCGERLTSPTSLTDTTSRTRLLWKPLRTDFAPPLAP